MQDIVKEKIQYLEKRGWKRIEPQLNFNHLFTIGFNEVLDSSGQFAADIIEAVKDNPFGWFGSKGKQTRQAFVEKLCPFSILPQAPLDVPHLQAQFPPINAYSEMDRVFEVLSMTVIEIACRRLLGTPTYLGQQIGDTVVIHTAPERFDWNDRDIMGELVAQWNNAHLNLSKQIQWNNNGTALVQTWQLYSNQLREIATAVMNDIGIEINGRAYQVGKLHPEYALADFPDCVREISEQLRCQLVGTNPIDRYNILIQGAPGTGKTRWAQSFAAEVLSPQGYLVAVLDFKSLEDFQVPDYVDKVCVILNDADNLCLDRETAQSGTTEKILAWLDGSRAGYIQPMYLPTRSSIVTILTANSTERWDSAGLRQGRIHAHYTFDRVLAV
jgi:ATPase family associated with various cellular activities (AAA)